MRATDRCSCRFPWFILCFFLCARATQLLYYVKLLWHNKKAEPATIYYYTGAEGIKILLDSSSKAAGFYSAALSRYISRVHISLTHYAIYIAVLEEFIADGAQLYIYARQLKLLFLPLAAHKHFYCVL
jgi:hypothetical protein